MEMKRERKREKGEKKMSRVNYYQSAFNSQKEKLNILAKMLEISKSGWIYSSTLSLQELLSELKKNRSTMTNRINL